MATASPGPAVHGAQPIRPPSVAKKDRLPYVRSKMRPNGAIRFAARDCANRTGQGPVPISGLSTSCSTYTNTQRNSLGWNGISKEEADVYQASKYGEAGQNGLQARKVLLDFA